MFLTCHSSQMPPRMSWQECPKAQMGQSVDMGKKIQKDETVFWMKLSILAVVEGLISSGICGIIVTCWEAPNWILATNSENYWFRLDSLYLPIWANGCLRSFAGVISVCGLSLDSCPIGKIWDPVNIHRPCYDVLHSVCLRLGASAMDGSAHSHAPAGKKCGP